MKKPKDFTGLRFGKLVAVKLDDIEKHPKRGDRIWWICDCDCGRRVSIRRYCLVTQNQKSCGCTWHRKGDQSDLWTGFGEISGQKWCKIRTLALRRNKDFSITIQDAWEQFQNQKGLCSLTGIRLFMNEDASLDRVDNTRGYVCGNIQWVHKKVNKLKSDFTQHDLIDWCKRIANYSESKE